MASPPANQRSDAMADVPPPPPVSATPLSAPTLASREDFAPRSRSRLAVFAGVGGAFLVGVAASAWMLRHFGEKSPPPPLQPPSPPAQPTPPPHTTVADHTQPTVESETVDSPIRFRELTADEGTKGITTFDGKDSAALRQFLERVRSQNASESGDGGTIQVVATDLPFEVREIPDQPTRSVQRATRGSVFDDAAGQTVPGWFKVKRETPLLSDPRANAKPLILLPSGMRIRVGATIGDYLEARSVSGGWNGYVLQADAAPDNR